MCRMSDTKHGRVASVHFSSEPLEGGSWRVSLLLVFIADEDGRIPLTFSVLGKAHTRLVAVSKGENRITDELVLDDPKGNNPFSFIGTDSVEALAKVDGVGLSGDVVLA